MPKIITLESFNTVQFYQIPQAFYHNPKYYGMNPSSRETYAMLCNLLSFSINNGWVNEEGEIYVKLSREKLMLRLGIGKDKMVKVFKELRDLVLIVEKRIGCNNMGVVFTSKGEKEAERYASEQLPIDVVTFAESRGKNDWSTCNKAFIVHTQFLPQHVYIYQYLHYFPEESSSIIGDNEAIRFQNGNGGVWTFVNNTRLHLLRITDSASNVYQSVKRVDRDSHNRLCDVELHVVCSNTQIVEIVQNS